MDHVEIAEERFTRIIQERRQRLKDIHKQVKEYDALCNKLQELPRKLTHSCMVPLGDLAFMPGTIEHSNEIMVLLGENYFVRRSASQAHEIAQRRRKRIQFLF